MVNLDVAAGLHRRGARVVGRRGPFTGSVPGRPDAHRHQQRRAARRLRLARQAGTILRGGYGISYNSGSYSSIARQLVGQPPFAVTDNEHRHAPRIRCRCRTRSSNVSPTETTNNYGVRSDYALGVVQTWNADVSRDSGQVWNVGGGYTHTRGSSLDIVRAPNRGPDGLRIPRRAAVPLADLRRGRRVLHAGDVPHPAPAGQRHRRRRDLHARQVARQRLVDRRRGTVVAQDDQNLAAEWGLSSFDRRHQLSANLNVELPFGPNRPWLNGGGVAGRRSSTTGGLTDDVHVAVGHAVHARACWRRRATSRRGTNGTLRADYNGQPIRLANPTIDRFFNTAAFTLPRAGHVRHRRRAT